MIELKKTALIETALMVKFNYIILSERTYSFHPTLVEYNMTSVHVIITLAASWDLFAWGSYILAISKVKARWAQMHTHGTFIMLPIIVEMPSVGLCSDNAWIQTHDLK